MSFIADLHVHSHYSMATSAGMEPATIWKWARMKGVAVVGTGDFTHPGWAAELDEKLEPAGNGLFLLKTAFRRPDDVPGPCRSEVFFLLSAEIACVYRKEGRTRRVHCLVFMPDMASASRLSRALARVGSVASDGRPILRIDAADLLKLALDACDEALLVPAHAWTPHFSVFGGAFGFDSLEECFGTLTPYVHAVETGLSSDPPMNWRVSGLDGKRLVSSSDAHSPSKIAREATVFACDASYRSIRKAIAGEGGDVGTIEFFPEEGKYHYDGHRACGVRFSPEETVRHNYLCPVCGRKVTLGVAHRVEVLADRRPGERPHVAQSFRAAVPLIEVLAEAEGVGPGSKTARDAYTGLLSALGSELSVLLDADLADIAGAASPRVAEAVRRVREGRVDISPGYDGAYGRIRIFPRPIANGIFFRPPGAITTDNK